MKYFPHGGKAYGEEDMLDFSANINPLGMPEKVRNAALNGVREALEYPDPHHTVLGHKAALKWGISPGMLLFGNGAAELLMHAVQACPTEVYLIPVPSFYEYERAAFSVRGRIRWIELDPQQDFLLDDAVGSRILSAAKEEREQGNTVTLLMGNPNNPTGNCIPETVLIPLLGELKKLGVRYLIDESFLPFVEDGEKRSVIPQLDETVSGGVLRSFTKIYGMPGLRLGALITGDAHWQEEIFAIRQPWPVSLPAQRAGEAALEEDAFVLETIALIRKEREYLCRELQHGLAGEIHAGPAPFLLLRAPADSAVRLREQKILIRPCENFRGLDATWFRIGIRTHEENQMLVERWRELM